MTTETERLAELIRAEAATSSRAGQMQSLEALADGVQRLSGGAPARPTREALAAALKEADAAWMPDTNWRTIDAFYADRADRLLAADHLWAEAPTVDTGVLVTVLTDHPTAEYRENVFPDGPWAGWGWVCVGCDAVLPLSRDDIPSGVPFLDWNMAQHVAERVAASGLFVDRATLEAEVYARAARETDAAWTASSGVAQRAIDAAVAEQREKDAQTALAYNKGYRMHPDDGAVDTAMARIAAAIRAGGAS